ncbi:MAG TPA: lamin tail domain-containing protein [Myxococcota bacterium]|nr:lamin tail domain-containing protein [Myxococcota bacterium]HRY91885.1 lamin tail domain-containing protein [Myxococcota bacterium]HSA23825.1 lamin tail domain-containing protein [Myxococcota bacterium]
MARPALPAAWLALLALGAAACGSGGAATDPCDGVACDHPPAARCEGGVRLTFGAGVCSVGVCRYDPASEVCPVACLAGQCVTDECDPLACTSPPADECEGTDTLLDYPAQGVCDPGGGCAYAPERVACPFGCAAAACAQCRQDGDCGAQPPVCTSGTTREVYEPRCLAGACQQEPTPEDCGAQGQVCENGLCSTQVRRPGPGDLVVTELMPNPAAVGDTLGEWFEIASTHAEVLELSGVRVGDADTVAFTLSPSASLPLQPGARLVLGANADEATNGGLPVDWDYGSFTLANTADSIALTAADGQLIDAVAYDAAQGWPLRAGASLLLRDGFLDAQQNDAPAAWCPAADPYGDGDQGTPGEAGGGCAFCAEDTDCPPPPSFCRDGTHLVEYLTACEGGECVQVDVETDCAATERICRVDACASAFAPPAAGELLVNEFLANPGAAGDADGEWVELLNVSGRTLELSGVVLRDDGTQRTTLAADRSLPVPTGGLLVVAASDDSAVNGGFKPDLVWGSFGLANTADEIVLEAPNGTVVDAVRYDTSQGWSMPSGASLQLDLAWQTAAGNDVPGHWCAATTPFGAGDLGTPGSANRFCDKH